MTNPNPHSGSVKIRPPGAALLLLATLAVCFAAMAAFASPARADVLKVTNKKDSGAGSLRDAIKDAAPTRDTIIFAPRVQGTITLTSGNLYIDKNLTIKGPGADRLAISGNNSDRVVFISSGKIVRMSGLTITRGNYSSGGGIHNHGNLTLTKSVVSGNFAGGNIVGGGGINNRNVLRLIESVVSGNIADDYGGGINNGGTLIVLRSTISGNRAAYGGGIYTLTYDPAKTVIDNSTISGNSISSASGAGGGVINTRGLTTIKNTTIADNTAPEGRGGGVYSDDTYATTEVFSSIMARNKGGFGPTGTFVSKGYNLVGSSQVANTFNKPGDRTGVGDPGLKPLAYNGGLTKTHALQKGSIAIDAGSSNCPSPGTDQRRVKRPQGGRCDIGAFEARPDFDLAPKGCTIFGTSGADILVGTEDDNIICGLESNDVIYSGAGNDTLKGGAGADKLYGQDGNDLINVRDKKPKDVANGGAGNDRCVADRGDRRAGCER